MNFRTTAILLILLLGVIGYVLFTGPAGSTSSEAVKTNPQRLLDIQSNDVSKVVLTSAGGKSIVLERSTQTPAAPAIEPAKSDWKITSPLTAYADAFKVSDLIDGVVSATSTSQVDLTAQNSADYGLNDPQYTIELDAGPKTAKVIVGRSEKTGNALYVSVEGKHVAEVISADLLDKLDTTPQKLRLARLVNVDSTTANWVSIARPKDPLTLEKSGGQWQMTTTQPTTLPVDDTAVSGIISAVNDAAAVDFADASAKSDILIGHPVATITVSDKKPSTQPSQTETLEFGVPDSILAKNVWVRVTPPGELATIPKDKMDAILKSSYELRDKNLVQIATSDITEVRVVKNSPAATQPIARNASLRSSVLARGPKPKVTVIAGPPLPTTQASTEPTTNPTTMATTLPATQPAAPPSEWQLTSGREPADADDAKVNALLGSFNPLKVEKYLESPPAASGQVTYYVTLTTTSGKSTDVMFSDPGETSTDSPWGVCNGAIFTCPRSIITALDVDFAKAQ